MTYNCVQAILASCWCTRFFSRSPCLIRCDIDFKPELTRTFVHLLYRSIPSRSHCTQHRTHLFVFLTSAKHDCFQLNVYFGCHSIHEIDFLPIFFNHEQDQLSQKWKHALISSVIIQFSVVFNFDRYTCWIFDKKSKWHWCIHNSIVWIYLHFGWTVK